MRNKYLSIAFGLFLSAGLAIAQAPDQNQPPSAPQAAPASPLAAENAPPMQQQRRAPDPARAARHLGKQLGLTQEQVAQIQPILADRQQALAGVRSDTSLAPRDRKAKARGIMQDSKGKIEALLTDTEKQQYEQMLQERRSQHKHQPLAQ
jgi:hypothetical protein